jgi:hypothetical protein
MWQNVLLEWERCNIFDGYVLTHLPKPIRKCVFGFLANRKEKQLEKLARGLLSKAITFKDHPTKGRKLDFKSTYKFTRFP